VARQSVEVLIIGGGVVGCSIAYHLARRGCRDVVVLEQETVGSGSSGKAAGGIRQQFSSEVCVRMSLVSLEAVHRFEAELGVDPGFEPCGYLFVTTDAGEMASFRRNVAMQRRLGVDTRVVTPAEIRAIHPWLHVDDLVGGTFCPTDGIAGPTEVTQAYARRARELGVRVIEETPVTAIDVAGDRVRAVETPRGRFSPGALVIAAGAWSGAVGRLLGVDIPVSPLRREIFVSEPIPDHPGGTPLVMEPRHGWYCRREGPGVLMAGGLGRVGSFDLHVDWANLGHAAELAVHRIPPLRDTAFTRAWAGALDITPDGNAVLGPIPGFERAYVAAGFSGHGFMHSPATGLVMAEVILEGASRTLDLTPLALDRFARGAPVPEVLLSHAHLEEG
jgi:sarcosine oxidase subunit beta